MITQKELKTLIHYDPEEAHKVYCKEFKKVHKEFGDSRRNKKKIIQIQS